MRKSRQKREGTNFWQSYSDMMAALLLMFVLIMTFTLLQSLRHYQELTASIEEAKLEYEKQQQALKEQTDKVVEQQTKLEEQQIKLEEQQAQIDKLIGVKADLIAALGKEFEGTNLAIKIDSQTGAIMLESSILFDYDRYVLKNEAKDFLKIFLPKYFNVLMSEEFAEYVGEIIVEGYTDNVGTYIYNLNLSQKRAFSIAEYCLDERNALLGPAELEKMKTLLTANGKSMNNLIYAEDGQVDADASRRVEFKFRLKDEDMIEALKQILEK